MGYDGTIHFFFWGGFSLINQPCHQGPPMAGWNPPRDRRQSEHVVTSGWSQNRDDKMASAKCPEGRVSLRWDIHGDSNKNLGINIGIIVLIL